MNNTAFPKINDVKYMNIFNNNKGKIKMNKIKISRRN